jgi:serine/threonine protein kinase
MVEAHRAVLADFGVATPINVESMRDMVVGTPDYIAPEVLCGSTAEPASDIYACGVVAYELLAGRRPFVHGGIVAAVERALSGGILTCRRCPSAARRRWLSPRSVACSRAPRRTPRVAPRAGRPPRRGDRVRGAWCA